MERPEERLTKPTLEQLRSFWQGYIKQYRPADEAKTSIVITNWRRPEKLRDCANSAMVSGLPLVIACCDVSLEVLNVLQELLRSRPDILLTLQLSDHGCNDLWLRGLYTAQTPYVQILHDDDLLSPEFGNTYRVEIEPKLGQVNWVFWDGQIVENGVLTSEYHKQFPRSTGIYATREALPAMLKRGTYARSPVVQIFRRDLAVATLEECQRYFTDPVFFTKPTMMVGNDVMLGLRHAAHLSDFLYVSRPLTWFGRWAGSETEIANRTGATALIRGYDATKDYFEKHQDRFQSGAVGKVRLVHRVEELTFSLPAGEYEQWEFDAVAMPLVKESVVPEVAVSAGSGGSGAQAVFSSIYANNVWGEGSGAGSAPSQTGGYRSVITQFLRDNKVGSVLDVGCGDWQLGRLVDWDCDYLGVDVVPELIQANQARFGRDNIRFAMLDALSDPLPDADVLLAKDVLQHWSNTQVQQFLKKLDKFRWVILTNDVVPARGNRDITCGDYRHLHLDRPPFNLRTRVLGYQPWSGGGYSGLKEICLLV